MPIIEIPSGKQLKDRNYDVEEIKKTTGTEIVDERLQRLLEKGYGTIYVWVNPYAAEIHDEHVLCGGLDYEVELDRFYGALEDI